MSADPVFDATVPTSSWHECHSGEHFVQFYEDDAVLENAVVEYIARGLQEGAAAVVIATAEHLASYERGWTERGVDLATAREQGRYVSLDAEVTLDKLLRGGWPQRAAFSEIIEPVIAAAASRGTGIFAFGEMVALLWRKRQYGAAIQLEALWNELASKHRFALFCAYPLGEDQHAPVDAIHQVCTAHARAIPTEKYTNLTNASERLAAICELQNKALLHERELADRKQLERQLARRELELSDFLENGVHPLHRVGADGTILWANRAELELLGYAAEEYIGHNVREFHDDSAAIESILARVLAGETVNNARARLRGKSGDIKHVVVSTNALWENGSFVHTRCFTRDITHQVDAEELRALAGAIVESSDDAIVSKTVAGIVTSWNRGAEHIFGYTAAEMIGQSITKLIPAELLHEETEILDELSRGQRIEHYETQRVARDGRRLDVSISVSPIRNAQGAIIGASKVARDITERKRADRELRDKEEALRRNSDAMREADRRKDEFLAVLAHELRNPLAPIRYALASAKKSGRTPEQIRRGEEIIDRQVSHMSRLLDDLLDVSRITRGTLELKKSRTELTAVIAAAIEAARPILDKKRHTLTVKLPSEPVRLTADPVRLAQVFSNLLINAGKYTDPSGQIELIAAQSQAEIVVRVRDNGIGISTQMLPRLFTMFSQAEGALTRSEGGLGIGLGLARGLIGLHEGTIAAHSEGPGRGSEFVVRLPVSAEIESCGAASPPESAPEDRRFRVLVVDDNRDAATTCGGFLHSCGHDVQVTFTGHSALALADHFRPHAIVLDIGMPGLDGYEVARRLRTRAWAEDCVLIAVTGWGQERDKERATDAGFDHHLTKPVDPAVLEPMLGRFCKIEV